MSKSKVVGDVTNTTKKPSVIGTFEGKCADSVENNNSMLLEKELWTVLFSSEEYKRNLQNGFYIGFLGHPEDPGCQEFKDACIVMREGHVDEDGQVYGKFDLIDTPVGRVVKAFIDAGVNFGISVRGAGDVAPDGYVDPDSFIFRGFDLVAFPAYDDAIPTFTALAASTDTESKNKYAGVCSAIERNIQSITSSEALDVMKAQFNPKSKQYDIIDKHQKSIEDADVDDEVEGCDDPEVLKQKLEAMTQLYLKSNSDLRAARQRNISLSTELDNQKKANRRLQRVMSSTKRIMSNQLSSIQASKSEVDTRYRKVVSANDSLKSELEKSNSQNLKYVQKIQSDSQIIAEKDSKISSLKSQIDKTVVASTRVDKKTSNLDAKVKGLSAKIAANEKLIADYQDAFATLYANAIGVGLDSVSVTASTSVDELKNMISQGTSTSGIPVAPSYAYDEEYDYEDDPIVEISDPNSEYDLVSL